MKVLRAIVTTEAMETLTEPIILNHSIDPLEFEQLDKKHVDVAETIRRCDVV